MRCGFFLLLAVSCGFCTGCKMSIVWPSKTKATNDSFDPFLDQAAESADMEREQQSPTGRVAEDQPARTGDIQSSVDEPEVADGMTAFPIGVVGTAESTAAKELAAEKEAVEAEIASTMLLLAEQKRKTQLEAEDEDSPEAEENQMPPADSRAVEQPASDEPSPEADQAKLAIQQAFAELEGELDNPESRVSIADDLPPAESKSEWTKSSKETPDSAVNEEPSQGVSE